MRHKAIALIALLATFVLPDLAQGQDLDFLNHNQPILDAHNCYPYEGHWNDRIQRALNSGFPVSIEQDLAWYVDPTTGKGRVVVSHTPHPTGSEPTLEDYFFKQVSPVVQKIIAENKRSEWPLIILHFDFKDNQTALLQAVWQVLGQHEGGAEDRVTGERELLIRSEDAHAHSLLRLNGGITRNHKSRFLKVGFASQVLHF